MKKKKKFIEVAIEDGKFFSTVSLDKDEIAKSDNTIIDIEMLRVGKFNHRVYGDLDITEEMLSTMVDNFYEDVIGREVSFDWNHKAEAASAWLKELKIEEGVLIGTTELTGEGKDSIDKKKYGYFSIEYSDDYEDSESDEKFGPTILGGALTNRPFISKLKKIEFSMKGDKNTSIYRLQAKEELNMKLKDKKIKRDPVTKKEDATLEESQAKNVELETKNEELEGRVKELEGSSDDKKFSDFILQQKEEMKILKNELDSIKGENKNLQETHVKTADKNRKLEVEMICEKLLTDDHHHPSMVGVAKQIMLSDSTGSKVIKFTETVGEGDDKKTIDIELSIKDAVLRILEAVPKTQRANYSENSTSDNGVQLSEVEQTNLENDAIRKSMRKKGLKIVETKGK